MLLEFSWPLLFILTLYVCASASSYCSPIDGDLERSPNQACCSYIGRAVHSHVLYQEQSSSTPYLSSNVLFS